MASFGQKHCNTPSGAFFIYRYINWPLDSNQDKALSNTTVITQQMAKNK